MINYLSQSFMLAYPIMNQPAVWAIDRIGLKFGLSIGIGMTTVGLWLKFLINDSFTFVIVGQTIVAMGQPFIMNACAKVSANWFPERERLTITAICGYSFILGVSIGMFIPSLFVN